MASSELIADVATHRILLFGLAERIYGCNIALVREIIPYRRPTRLPGAPECVPGLINLRGTIVTVIDLGIRLEAGAAARAEGSIILVERGAGTIGVAVDEVMDVQLILAEDIQATSETGILCDDVPGGAGLVRGLGRLDDGRFVILLEMHTIVEQVLL